MVAMTAPLADMLLTADDEPDPAPVDCSEGTAIRWRWRVGMCVHES